MRLLVTGASGFLGSYVTRALVERGHEVHGTGLGVGPGENSPPKVAFYFADLKDEASMGRAFAAARPEAVVHLAGFSSAGRSWHEAEECLRLNVGGTQSVLALAADHGARVVLASTAEVYGQSGSDDRLLSEEMPVAPVSPYGASKAQAESLVLAAGGTVARLFSVVGVGQAETFVIPSFVQQLAAGARVLHVGNLEVRRDFLHPRDAGEAFAVLIERGISTIYNVATGISRSLAEVVKTLERLAGHGVEVRIDPARIRLADPQDLRGDSSRLRALGWWPKHDFEDSLAELWAHAVAHATARAPEGSGR